MRAQILWRKVHYWLSITVAVPLLVIVCTGLLLQVKKDFHWIQPHELRGSGGPPRICFDEILATCAVLPHVGIKDWRDIQRLDFRPEKSLLKVTTRDHWEVQIDPADGRVMQVALRRSDLIESLHDGSWFGGAAKRWIFLPTGAMLTLLWGTGIYLFLLPYSRRRGPAGKS